MAQPFLAEIKILSYAHAPQGWAKCDGQLLPINQNQALFSLLGTMYGGNGQTNFALPDMRARTPIHKAHPSHLQGERAGEQSHTVTHAEMPTHTHPAHGTTTNADSASPSGNFLGAANNLYAPAGNATSLHPSSVTSVGGSQPHENMQPYLALNFCIALQGIFPSAN